jgi:hypothetical protein
MTTPTSKKRRRPTRNQKIVFGHDVKLDEKGRPIEQGIGSASQPTVSHWEARLKTAHWDAKFHGRDITEEIKICEAGLAAAKEKAIAENLEAEGEEEDDDEF